MKKITVILAAILITLSMSCTTAHNAADSAKIKSSAQKQEFYELRVYRIESAEKQKVVSTYLEKALLPALKRISLNNVGVFTVKDAPEDFSIYVLITYPKLQTFAKLNDKLAADKYYNRAATDYFALGIKNPPFTRIESRLMKAFAGIPAMEIPAQTKTRSQRMFEVRIYESHNENKARKKVDMFNTGEIQVMRDTKLAPVFFGETLIGSDVPNLTYMLSASDIDAHKKHWKAFMAHPEWNRMKKLPKYKDTVSKITKTFLIPTKYSQL
ncbi:MAG: NIPSNAP family containing protein [Planctomycetes bacterium]|nr:NIPSNAP family containing protein [Planctomycetota bacterium]